MVTTEFTVWSWLAAGPARYEPALPQVSGLPELTTYKAFGPYSIQKTSLIGEGSPALYVVLPHHRYTMWD